MLVPQTISGLQLWLDASDASTLYDATTGGSLVAADGAVKRWEDKSGNARHATQSTNGPTRKTSLINGLDALTFDGTNDLLRLPTSAINFGFGNFEVLIVGRSGTPASQQGFLVVQDNTTGAAAIFRMAIIGGVLHFALRTSSTPAKALTDSSSYTADSLVMFGARRSSSTLTVTKNGSSFGSDTFTGSLAATSVEPGVGAYSDSEGAQDWFLDGEICEIIAYNAALSSGDRAAVESYLMTKWGIS
jgi:hypothetical protein